MNKKQLYILFFLFCFCSVLQAQVTIGSLDAPAKTAILDIKEKTPTNPTIDNSTVTTGGLGMPRVNLVDLESLKPFIDPSDGDYNEQKILNTGLTVYNTARLGVDISPGIYYWNGNYWEPVIATSQNFMLKVEAKEIVFPANVGLANPSKELIVAWSPAANPCNLTLTPILKGGIKGYAAPPTTNTEGFQRLRIAIDAMTQAEINADPFFERASQLLVVATDGVGGYKQEETILRQINYALTVDGFRDKMELGENYTFTVASNTDWDVAVSDPNGILESHRTLSGGNNTNGEEFNFRIKDDNTKEGFSATFTFTNPDNKFPAQVHKITATRYYPNSYIVPIGGSVDIPIRKAYNVWSQELGTTLPATGVTTELIWQDVPSLVTSYGLKSGDQGIDSNIRITTNGGATAGGNAVVAVKVGGVVRWSWHIWVTNYNPNSAEPTSAPSTVFRGTPTNVIGGKIFNYNNGIASTVFMDRNLGAVNTTVGDRNNGHHGYMYQWGRKDPFPGVKFGNAGYVHREIYNASNTALTPGAPTGGTGINNIAVSSAANLGNTILNPRIFYLGIPLNDYDWYSATPDVHNDLLWNDENGNKGIYDPCPDGWRVPQTTGGYSSPWMGLSPITFTDGFDWTSIGAGYYPNSAYKTDKGDFDLGAGRGMFASAAVNGAFKYAMYIDFTNVSYGPYPRARGEAVRCTKIIAK